MSTQELIAFDNKHINDLHNYIYNSHFSTEWLMKFADLLDFKYYYNSNAEEFFSDAVFLGANPRYELITHIILYIRDCIDENKLSNIWEYILDNENKHNLALPPDNDDGIDICIAESYNKNIILYKHIVLMNLTDGEYIKYLI